MFWSTIPGMLIMVVLIAAGVALVVVALKKFNVEIPEWVKQIFWIVVVALVVIAAIVFLWRFASQI